MAGRSVLLWVAAVCAALTPRVACVPSTTFRVTEAVSSQADFGSLSTADLQSVLGAQLAVPQFGDALGDEVAPFDGRLTQRVISCPAGELGNLITALSVLEQTSNGDFNADFVQDFLRFHLDNSAKQITFVTDLEGLSELCHMLHVCPAHDLEMEDKIRELTSFLVSPPKQYQAVLEEAVIDPRLHFGVLKSMLRFPGRYLVNVDTVHSVLLGYFRLLWSGGAAASRLGVSVLEGDRVPSQAFVSVRAADDCPRYLGLALATQIGESHVTAFHPEACAADGEALLSHLKEFMAYARRSGPEQLDNGSAPKGVDSSLDTLEDTRFASWTALLKSLESNGPGATDVQAFKSAMLHQLAMAADAEPGVHLFDVQMDASVCPARAGLGLAAALTPTGWGRA